MQAQETGGLAAAQILVKLYHSLPRFVKRGRDIINENGKKMGRPTNDPRKNGYRIRMTDKEVKLLDECCSLTGLSKADVIRLGIEMVYKNSKQ